MAGFKAPPAAVEFLLISAEDYVDLGAYWIRATRTATEPVPLALPRSHLTTLSYPAPPPVPPPHPATNVELTAPCNKANLFQYSFTIINLF